MLLQPGICLESWSIYDYHRQLAERICHNGISGPLSYSACWIMSVLRFLLKAVLLFTGPRL